MTIGVTYDLREEYLAAGYRKEEVAELDVSATIAAIEEALKSYGHRVERIGGGRALMQRLVAGRRWDLVFNIAEGFHGPGREAQVPGILELFQIPYTFSDPVVLGITLNKYVTNRLVRSFGIPTADFLLARGREDLGGWLGSGATVSPRLLVKPVGEGSGKGITAASIVRDGDALLRRCEAIWSGYGQPALIEEFLPGREFTVGILGTATDARLLGVLEVSLSDSAEGPIYSYRNKEECETRVRYSLAGDREAVVAGDIALAVWQLLGCRDAGRVDLRSDSRGRPRFLEVNPLPGLNPTHSDLPILCSLLGKPYRRLIGEIVDAALSRRELSPEVRRVARISV